MRRTLVAFVIALAAWRAVAADAAETRQFVRGSWAEIRKDHARRPAIVHIWGLSCGPCLAELPDWAAFLKAHPGTGLVLINGDRPSDKPWLADDRLVKAGLGEVERWSFAETHGERLRFEIDPGWQGELPYTLLIARDGTTSTFSGSANFGELSAWLDTQRQ